MSEVSGMNMRLDSVFLRFLGVRAVEGAKHILTCAFLTVRFFV